MAKIAAMIHQLVDLEVSGKKEMQGTRNFSHVEYQHVDVGQNGRPRGPQMLV